MNAYTHMSPQGISIYPSPSSEVQEMGAGIGFPPDTRKADLAKKMLTSVPSQYVHAAVLLMQAFVIT